MEEWRSIPGYEKLYEASNEGRIRSCEGKVTKSARFEHRVWKQRIMKQKRIKNRRGRTDYRVSLWKDGHEKTWLVSRLVALAFCEGYSEGMTVNHIDGNPQNNKAENLEWCTIKENIQKGFDNGLYSSAKTVSIITPNGEKHKFRSMSEAGIFLGKGRAYISTMVKRNKLNLPSGYIITMDGKYDDCAM